MNIHLIKIFVSSVLEAEKSFYFLLIILLRVATNIVYNWMKYREGNTAAAIFLFKPDITKTAETPLQYKGRLSDPLSQYLTFKG